MDNPAYWFNTNVWGITFILNILKLNSVQNSLEIKLYINSQKGVINELSSLQFSPASSSSLGRTQKHGVFSSQHNAKGFM